MTTGQRHQCPLCGYTFDATALACHTSCPLGKGCHILCCPHCGYQVPDENRMSIAGTLKRAWESRQAGKKERQA